MAAHQHLKKTVYILSNVWISIAHFITPVLNKNKQYSVALINEVQRLSTVIPKHMALKLAGISGHAFQYMLHKINTRCHDSAFNLCFRKHPLQLSFKEINTMKSLLTDIRFVCWPISSIAYFAQRNNILAACVSTWYKYVDLIGFNKKTPKGKESHTGLITTAPNQFLHVDTTFWNIEHDLKAAIVLVSDNFSKAILGWSVSLKKNAENVSCALNNAIQTIHSFHPHHVCATLMADGGKENHNTTISELLQATTNPEITKISALKDIAFSNASIEAINKILKVYLRFHKPATLEQLIECIQTVVYDYSFVHPHGSLNGMIPMEVYTNQALNIDTNAFALQAKTERIEHNRKHTCGTCY
ncbi:hypothetical protein [uncultured Cytophaga sp.]|uniref:hypothetical protein n=1 Tax=uncultured Cytophaga sp. TaxID=160238 RepID=UPI002601D9AF|nr:hypothetical protein [uncultured Cytophaga sp.]